MALAFFFFGVAEAAGLAAGLSAGVAVVLGFFFFGVAEAAAVGDGLGLASWALANGAAMNAVIERINRVLRIVTKCLCQARVVVKRTFATAIIATPLREFRYACTPATFCSAARRGASFAPACAIQCESGMA